MMLHQPLEPGTPIWYRHQHRGGYGYESDVPGTFLGCTRSHRRFSILVELRDGTQKRIAVSPARVRVRQAAR